MRGPGDPVRLSRMNGPAPTSRLSFVLDDEAATEALAQSFAGAAKPGRAVLLDGPVGVGKSVFARHAIRSLQAAVGISEDIPSPTFTLVQTYITRDLEIWHADLYRLTSAEEVIELGLEDALRSAFCLIEWPDRLGPNGPENAYHLKFAHLGDANQRRVEIKSPAASVWADLDLSRFWGCERD